jgi:hypothetical protein
MESSDFLQDYAVLASTGKPSTFIVHRVGFLEIRPGSGDVTKFILL